MRVLSRMNPDIGYEPCPNCNYEMTPVENHKNDHCFVCDACGEVVKWDD